MPDGPYRTGPPFLTYEDMRGYLKKRLWYAALLLLVVVLFCVLGGFLWGSGWSDQEQDERLENQEFRTSVLWKAVEEVRYDSSVSRCRYVAGQRDYGAKCAWLCLEELEDVSRLSSTKQYDACLECLFMTGSAMPYQIRTGDDLSLKALQKVLRERRRERERLEGEREAVLEELREGPNSAASNLFWRNRGER